MKNLTVTIIQSDLQWENKKANLQAFAEKIKSAPSVTDLIILPEMFTTGFSMKPETLAETMDGQTVRWMRQQAKSKGCAITGSFMCEEKGKYYNRLVWMNKDGSFKTYDKRHLFSMGDENNHYTAGTKRVTVTLNGWKICPLICYDLRFPVWSRNTKTNPYDLLLYIASWPAIRRQPWEILLRARAIENQCFVAGVNRIGPDGNGIAHNGLSAVINPKGKTICKTKNKQEDLQTVTLIREELDTFRDKFPVLNDAD